MIDVKHLTKTYGSVQAVKDVSFTVGANEVVGFLGPNGAGKSTTLRIIAGFLGATRGQVVVDGIDTVQEPIRARAKIGYMPENVPLYPEMRVEEYLRFRAELKRVPRKQRRDAVTRAMREVHLDDHGQVIIGNLSKGYRQRVGLADALVSRPAVLILDEPTAGLDPNQIRDVRDLIRSLAKQHAVLLSTHIMSEVEATCDRAMVIDHGRLVAQGSLDELRKLRQSNTTRFVMRGDKDQAMDLLRSTGRVRSIRENTHENACERSIGSDVVVLDVLWARQTNPVGATEEAVQALVSSGILLREVVPVKASLDDVFALLTDDLSTGAPATDGGSNQAQLAEDRDANDRPDNDRPGEGDSSS